MLRHEIVSGLLGFAVTVALAVAEGWTATDFAWSMWVSTLTLGSAILLLVSLAVLIVPSFNKTEKAPWRARLFVAGAIGGFILGIFILFHVVHSQFLQSFLPPVFATAAGHGPQSPGDFFLLFKMSLQAYWKFVVLSAVLWGASIVASIRAGDDRGVLDPFQSMVKMHVTILLLCFMNIVNLGHYALYLLLLVYYFPLEILQRQKG